ncbi:MAG: hypothetical protein KAS39_00235, partial [Actinomycetia bacterium]|nr:hypothetical protein [Actinomycetes bacterium]
MEGKDNKDNLFKRIITFSKKRADRPRKTYNTIGERVREYFEILVSALIMALLIRSLIVSAYKIPTGSMQPTLRGANSYGVGDHLLGNRFIFGAKIPFTDIRLPKIREPRRLDIMIFRDPRTPYPSMWRRIFALPV